MLKVKFKFKEKILKKQSLTIVNIYSDGACSGNQNEINAGGWGVLLETGEHTKELYGGEKNTTNNKMELTALLEGLKSLKRYNLKLNIYSDSSYVINGLSQKWYLNWQKNGWKTSKKQPVENKELWQGIIKIITQISDISYFHVKGHLDLNKKSDVRKWKKKFETSYGNISDVKFEKLIKLNHRVDELANLGIKSLE